MKENIYDNESFFAAYSRFPRSAEGLNAAGEWHELQRLLPDFTGKRVLDIGCGFGWHCAYAAENGAARVLGVDISEKMLAEAGRRTRHPAIEYRRAAMEDLSFPSGEFDAVVSSLAFHYTPDFACICARVRDWLVLGGDFVFSVEHPVFTAHGRQQWALDESGSPVHWPVDRYFEEGERNTVFLGESVVKYHRTLATYLGDLLKSGFSIEAVVEPQPAPHLIERMPDERRRPMMLLVAAKRR